ncbi:MAG: hypothetical protein AB7V46_19275 [Thermomicrobiales bacterium]
MTISSHFSAVEWSVLCELPQRVVASAINADPMAGIGSIIEEVAGLTQLSQGAMERPESELVQAVFAEYKRDGKGEARTLELSQQAIENLIPETLQMVAQVSDLLARSVEPAEAAAFVSWLREAAESTCGAARSGGILGIGGKRISEAESVFLAALESAFATAISLPAE